LITRIAFLDLYAEKEMMSSRSFIRTRILRSHSGLRCWTPAMLWWMQPAGMGTIRSILCGRWRTLAVGHSTHAISRLVRSPAPRSVEVLNPSGLQFFAFHAHNSSQALLKRELPTMIDWILPQQHGNGQVRVQWEHRSHLELLQSLPDKSVRVVAFNLGSVAP